MAAFNVLRIHCETVCLLALAAASIALVSSDVKRTGTIFPFAWPFGSLGRPILAFRFKLPRLLQDHGPYCILSRFDWMEMQYRNVSHWLLRVIGFVRPSIDSGCFRMPMQVEHLDDSFPYRLALEFLLYGHALNVHRFRAMQSPDHV